MNKGYKALPFFKQSEIIHDFTVEFIKKYVNSKSRTCDQMEQAARSGKQNIAEGYLQKSLKSRIKLLGVSRGSLEELLNDYLDFLRQHQLVVWKLDDYRAQEVRGLVYKSYNDYNNYKNYISSPELAANAMVYLINQTNTLIDSRLRSLEERFVKEGGYTENLFQKRLLLRQS